MTSYLMPDMTFASDLFYTVFSNVGGVFFSLSVNILKEKNPSTK